MGGPLVLKVRREDGDVEPRLVVELHHLQMGRVGHHLFLGKNIIVRADVACFGVEGPKQVIYQKSEEEICEKNKIYKRSMMSSSSFISNN